MTRYQALRQIGLDPISAALVALMNWLRCIPDGEARAMSMRITYPANQQHERGEAS